MGRKKDVILGVANATSYKWDGSSRPMLSDYTQPWASYANLETYEDPYSWSRKQKFNDAVTYARTMYDAAVAQYKDDLSFWQEQDTRDYNHPVSASSRLDDAGYNMGYMYSSVDAGYSDGYSQNSYDPEFTDERNDPSRRIKNITGMVSDISKVAIDLVKMGVSLYKVPFEIRKIESESKRNESSAILNDVESGMKAYLLNTNSSGENVEEIRDSLFFDMSLAILAKDSASASASTANASYLTQRANELSKWLEKYADAQWSKDTTKDTSQYLMSELENSDMPQWAKIALVILGNIGGRISSTLK